MTDHLRWKFTDRWGGVSQPPYDRLNLGGHVGDDPADVETNRSTLGSAVWMTQVHGDGIVVVDREPELTPTCDGIVTSTAGLTLAVLVADCIPVLMADSHAGVVAAVHAGRAGVRNGVVFRALDAMEELGARRDRVEVWLGPSICGACYEVPAPMQADVASVAPAAAVPTRWGTPGLDLRKGLVELLRSAVRSAESVGPCTFESSDHYSYRRDSVTGRAAGVITWGA
jgi:YfiH family protein